MNNIHFSYKLLFFWLFFIILFSSSYVFFKTPFEFYFHYIFFIALTPVFILKYGIPKLLPKLLLIPLLIGLIHVAIGNNNAFTFVKIFGGLSLTILFFYHILFLQSFDVKKLFYWYCKCCYLLSFIGVIQIFSFLIGFKFGYDFSWILNKWGVIHGGLIGIRVNSILSEPSQLGIVLSPALYVAINNLVSKTNIIINKIQSVIILVVVILTTSSVAYIGLLICILLVFNTLKFRFLIIGLSISLLMFNISYQYVDDFRLRVDAARGLWIENDFKISNTNNSSFVLYNNLHIAAENLKSYPIFGTGLGSHETAFKNHTLTNTIINYDFEFNVKDGNSLLIRLCTETGLFGVIFVLLLCAKSFIINNNISNETEISDFKLISQAIFVLIILSLIRQGNYMLNGLPLMFLIYYFNFKGYKEYLLKNSQS
tara:strand:+ start:11810 stop:13087 length:1278 start_codon:yes stop_codon:yes gene_type:complete